MNPSQETRRSILRKIINGMVMKAVPPPQSFPAVLPKEHQGEFLTPLTVHNKFLVQISVNGSALPCACPTCRQQQRVCLQQYIRDLVADWCNRTNPLHLKNPEYCITIVREP